MRSRPADQPLEFVQHTFPERSNGITVDWTAPAARVGPIEIWASVNAADGDGTENGDHLYNTSLTLNAPCVADPKPAISAGGVVSAANFGARPDVARLYCGDYCRQERLYPLRCQKVVHRGNPEDQGCDPRGSVRLENLQAYVPGIVQILCVTAAHPEAARWGFQLTARFITGGGAIQAGTFAPVDAETKVVCDDGSLHGSGGPCEPGQHQWIEHANPPRSDPGAGHTFEFQWTPPSQENGDGTLKGDRTYTGKARAQSHVPCTLTTRPRILAAVNAGSHAGPFSSNAMVELYGAGFQRLVKRE